MLKINENTTDDESPKALAAFEKRLATRADLYAELLIFKRYVAKRRKPSTAISRAHRGDSQVRTQGQAEQGDLTCGSCQDSGQEIDIPDSRARWFIANVDAIEIKPRRKAHGYGADTTARRLALEPFYDEALEDGPLLRLPTMPPNRDAPLGARDRLTRWWPSEFSMFQTSKEKIMKSLKRAINLNELTSGASARKKSIHPSATPWV